MRNGHHTEQLSRNLNESHQDGAEPSQEIGSNCFNTYQLTRTQKT